MTQKSHILQLLKDHSGQWVPKHELVNVKTPYGLLTARADRTLRDMANKWKMIEATDKLGNETYYRTKRTGITNELRALKSDHDKLRPITQPRLI